MFYKIVFVTSLVIISSGGTDPQKKSNHATYSQSFYREDVPLSYKYSAVHTYGPHQRGAPAEPTLTKTDNNPESKPIYTHIQYAPLPNPKEQPYETNDPISITEDNTYQTKSVLYTSVTANPAHEYRQYKKPEIATTTVVSKNHLEPKPVPLEVKNIKPITYKPHLYQNALIFQSPQNSFQANYYQNTRYPVITTTEAAQRIEMANVLKYFQLHQQGQHPKQQFNYESVTTTESPRNSYSDTSNTFLPKQVLHQEQSIPVKTIPHEYNAFLGLHPVPRIAYLNNFKTPTEKRRRRQKYSIYNYVHFQPKIY